MADEPNLKIELEEAILNSSLPTKVSELDFGALGEAGKLIAQLHNERSFNVFAHFENLTWNNLSSHNAVRISYVLESTIAAVRDTSERLWPFIQAVRNCVPDNHSHHIERGLESWAAANPAQVPEMVAIVKDGDQDCLFLGALLRAWTNVDPASALNAAIVLSGDERLTIKRQAITAFGSIICTDDKKAAMVENRLIELLSSAVEQDQCTAIAVINRILEKQKEKSGRLARELEKVATKPTAGIRHELIAGLAYHRNAYPDVLRSNVFELMKTVQSDSYETLQLIDSVLFNMDLDTERDAVYEVVTAILTQDCSAPKLNTFDSFANKLETSPHKVLGWYVTQWLLSGQYLVCVQLTALFPPLDNSVYEFNLDEFDLSDAEIIYFARKTYAYLMFAHGPAVSLLCASLMSLQLKERKKLETDIASFWLRNFPDDMSLFNLCCKTYPSKGLKAAIARIQRQVDAYERPLRLQSENFAIRPSITQRRIQAEIANARNKEINRTANEMSVFGPLVHKSFLLYGRSSVTYIDPGGGDEPIRQVIQLQSYETNFALPRMDVLYPTRLAYLLYCFRQERRPE